MDLVEEPLSGALVPARLVPTEAYPNDGSLLICTALRSKRVALIDVQVYALAVYGDPEAIFASHLNATKEVEDPVNALYTSLADKIFCLTLLRSVSGRQIGDGFSEALGKNAGVPKEELDQMAASIPSSIAKGAELRITVSPKNSTLTMYTESSESTAVTMNLPETCRGLHELYFGPKPVVKGVADSLQRQQPWWLIGQAAPTSFSADAGAESESDCSEGVPSFTAPRDSRASVPNALSSIPDEEEPEAEDLDESNTFEEPAHAQASASFQSQSQQSSWKDRSGRTTGKDGYKFGDITRTLLRARVRSSSSSDDDCFPGALVPEIEDGGVAWVEVADVPHLTEEALIVQSLQADLYKHHSSPVRGRLVPQWSLRHYELKAGVLQYRRSEGRKVRDSFSLEGAYVVAEPSKASRLGDCYVFRVVKGNDVVCRLSCPNRARATEWVLAIAAACAYFHSKSLQVRTPPVEETPASAVTRATAEMQTAQPETLKQEDQAEIGARNDSNNDKPVDPFPESPSTPSVAAAAPVSTQKHEMQVREEHIMSSVAAAAPVTTQKHESQVQIAVPNTHSLASLWQSCVALLAEVPWAAHATTLRNQLCSNRRPQTMLAVVTILLVLMIRRRIRRRSSMLQ